MKVVLTNGIEKEMSLHTPTLGYRIKSVTFTAKDMAELYDHSRKGLNLNEWFGVLATRFPPPVEDKKVAYIDMGVGEMLNSIKKDLK